MNKQLLKLCGNSSNLCAVPSFKRMLTSEAPTVTKTHLHRQRPIANAHVCAEDKWIMYVYIQCHIMLYYIIPCRAMPCQAMPQHIIPCHTMFIPYRSDAILTQTHIHKLCTHRYIIIQVSAYVYMSLVQHSYSGSRHGSTTSNAYPSSDSHIFRRCARPAHLQSIIAAALFPRISNFMALTLAEFIRERD